MTRPDDPPTEDAGPPEAQDVEAQLLQELQGTEQHLEQVTVALIQCYTERRQPERALPYAARLLALAQDSAQESRAGLRLGGLLEQVNEYASAAAIYRRVLPLEPTDPVIGYYAYNNLGYCLIQLGNFAEADALCRQAIQRNPRQYNAHKNLGLALAGQRRYQEAAWSLLAAVRAEPRDSRALRHLKELVRAHGAVLRADATLTAVLAACGAIGREQN